MSFLPPDDGISLAPLETCLRDAKATALAAWAHICHFHRGEFEVHQKADGPVTEADRAADLFIVDQLTRDYSREKYGYLSEEFENDPERLVRPRVWIIDPIDGTEDFVKGRDDFAIHIGLSEDDGSGRHIPVVGVVYHPRAEVLYSAVRGAGSWRETEIRRDGQRWWRDGDADPDRASFSDPERLEVTDARQVARLTAVVSKSHMTRRLQSMLDALPLKKWYRRGSLGVKLMEVATGRADIYVNTERGKCKEWDICAPHVILTEAGGRITNLDGGEMAYNRRSVILPAGILATNGHCHEEVLTSLREIPELYPG